MSDGPLDRIRDIERHRRRVSIRTAVLCSGGGLLLFACFALGHALGPMPLRPLEAALGGTGAFLIGGGLAGLFTRRALEGPARTVLSLAEGPARRRVVVYDGYVVLDDEIVLAETVDRAERTEDGRLVLRYLDPVAAGPLIRELEGPGRALDAVADALSPQAAAEEASTSGTVSSAG